MIPSRRRLAYALTVPFVLLSSVALAEPGIITGAVNVRDGWQGQDETEVLDVAQPGERVNIEECRGGFCLVDREGDREDGWVWDVHLSVAAADDEDDPDLQPADEDEDEGDDEDEGNDGDGDEDVVDEPVVVDDDEEVQDNGDDEGNDGPPPVAFGSVCIFLEPNFGGDERTCLPDGTVLGDVNVPSSASLLNPHGIKFKGCTEPGFAGTCSETSGNVEIFGREIRSLALGNVQIPAPEGDAADADPAPAPVMNESDPVLVCLYFKPGVDRSGGAGCYDKTGDRWASVPNPAKSIGNPSGWTVQYCSGDDGAGECYVTNGYIFDVGDLVIRSVKIN